MRPPFEMVPPGRRLVLLPCSPRRGRRAASMSSRTTGCVRKYLAPFWSDWSSAWWSWLMVRIGQLRVLDGELADHLQGFLLVGVEGDDGQVRQ